MRDLNICTRGSRTQFGSSSWSFGHHCGAGRRDARANVENMVYATEWTLGGGAAGHIARGVPPDPAQAESHVTPPRWQGWHRRSEANCSAERLRAALTIAWTNSAQRN